MITKKKLLKRIKSLEDELGLYFVPADFKDDYDTHKVDEEGYQVIPRLVANVKELLEKKK